MLYSQICKMLNIIKKYIIEIISGVFLTVTVLIVIVNVILRYFFNAPLAWVEEVSTGCFIWSVFIGIASAYKYRKHIGIDLLVNIVGKRLAKIIPIIIDVLTGIISGYIAYLSILYMIATPNKTTPVLEISANYISSAIFVGFFLVMIQAIIFIVQGLKSFKEEVK